jgi:putative nucleotidyltransferase with HDIG domain
MANIFLILILMGIVGVAIGSFIWYLHLARGKEFSSMQSGESDDGSPADIALPVDIDPLLAKLDEHVDTAAQQAEETEAENPTVFVSTHADYLSASEISQPTLEALRNITESLPRLPSVSLDMLPVLSCRGAGSKQIAAIIERDQATAAKLLRWVNSCQFGLEGKVMSLHRAVTLLGIDTIRSVVLEDSLSRINPRLSVPGISQQTIWLHTTAVSIISKALAGWVRGQTPDVAGTAGLLHDIGILLMMMTERKKLEQAIADARAANEPLIAHEDAVIGFNHQTWGEVFIRAWRLPEEIACGIGSHHSPMREPFNPLSGIIWLADYLASRIGFPSVDNFIPSVDEGEIVELMDALGLQPPLDRYVTENLARELVIATRYWKAGNELFQQDAALAK